MARPTDLKPGEVALNSPGIRAILRRPEVAAMVNAMARRVAAQIDGDDVHVDEYTTDRAAAAVVVPAERQAVDGALTRAAAAVGLEVKQ